MLEELKKNIIRISKDAQQKGLCQPGSGNFSERDKETGYVAVTPAGLDRMKLKTDDIIIVDLDGNIIEAKEGRRPSSETMMHLQIYKTREDIFGVAHTHSKYATSFAVLNKEIPALVYELASMGLKEARIPVAPFATPGTPELAKTVIESCKIANAFLMEKHGAVGIGEDLEKAYVTMQYLEDIAEIYFNVLMINNGKEPESFTQKDFDVWKYPEKLNLED
ncbi:class II aldolase/adducin family protein [Anaerococcus porci]|uniref:class II aldolase/adducin family protein n=1 Tax=Anaerococcus porci TaxID=2652269 RepID=UPI002A74F054|nr:class II aldolase/adducin family protein [Anaerococcus porci]MDY3006361.1 class II aldolase/adducin family protein [Anaerococcus porci]